MTKKPPPDQISPSACFLVERAPSKGYHVAASEGRYADQWKKRALDLLDVLGQPDPNGPAEYCRLIGPMPPSGEYVSVRVQLKENGEARFDQAWYELRSPVIASKRLSGLPLVGIFALGVAIGVVAGPPFFRPSTLTNTPATERAVGHEDRDRPNNSPQLLEQLKKELNDTKALRDKLEKFLSKFVPDPRPAVVEEKRSVALLDDRDDDKEQPERQVMRLNNVEVDKLVNLIKALKRLEGSAILSYNSEGQ